MYINDNTSKGTNGGKIDVSGSKATGVYNSGTFEMTSGSISVEGANATAFYIAKDSTATIPTTTIKAGSISITGQDSNNSAIGLGLLDGATVDLGVHPIYNSSVNNSRKNYALLVYN